MIQGLHLLLYSTHTVEDRRFLRDVLGWAGVVDGPSSEQAGEDWWILATPPAEVGVHPMRDSTPPVAGVPARAELSLICDDLAATVEELRGKGVEPVNEATERGYGVACEIALPSGAWLQLYQPHHVAPALGQQRDAHSGDAD